MSYVQSDMHCGNNLRKIRSEKLKPRERRDFPFRPHPEFLQHEVML
jgi:hypothetical protein